MSNGHANPAYSLPDHRDQHWISETTAFADSPMNTEPTKTALMAGPQQPTSSTYDWIIDSGATIHICCHSELFTSARQLDKVVSFHAVGEGFTSSVIGTVVLPLLNNETLVLEDVYLVPRMRCNLLSVAQILRKGLYFVQDMSGSWFVDPVTGLHMYHGTCFPDLACRLDVALPPRPHAQLSSVPCGGGPQQYPLGRNRVPGGTIRVDDLPPWSQEDKDLFIGPTYPPTDMAAHERQQVRDFGTVNPAVLELGHAQPMSFAPASTSCGS